MAGTKDAEGSVREEGKVPGLVMDGAEIQCCAGSGSILEAVPVTLN